MPRGDKAGIGRIIVHPAGSGEIDRNPGMGGVGADQPWLAGRRLGKQVAAHVGGGQPLLAQAADEQVGEILAHAPAVRDDFGQRRRDPRRFAVKGKGPVEAAADQGEPVHHRQARFQVLGEFVGQRAGLGEQRHEGRGVEILLEREIIADHRLPDQPRDVGQGRRQAWHREERLFPGDQAPAGDHQFLVGLPQGEEMLLVAEVVESRGEVGRMRRDLELEAIAMLGGLIARLQVQGLPGGARQGGVRVAGGVGDAVTAHGAARLPGTSRAPRNARSRSGSRGC